MDVDNTDNTNNTGVTKQTVVQKFESILDKIGDNKDKLLDIYQDLEYYDVYHTQLSNVEQTVDSDSENSENSENSEPQSITEGLIGSLFDTDDEPQVAKCLVMGWYLCMMMQQLTKKDPNTVINEAYESFIHNLGNDLGLGDETE